MVVNTQVSSEYWRAERGLKFVNCMPWIVFGNLVSPVGGDIGAGEPETGSAGLVCVGASKSSMVLTVDH
jgi:hypothetical protein